MTAPNETESVHALPEKWREDADDLDRRAKNVAHVLPLIADQNRLLAECNRKHADELERALSGARPPVAWQYLGTSSLAGPWPHPEWRICDDHEAAAAAGFEVRPLYTAPAPVVTDAMVERARDIRERLINSHISAFIDGEKLKPDVARGAQAYCKSAIVDAASLIEDAFNLTAALQESDDA